MATHTISSKDLFDTIKVELWGSHFQVREATRTVEEKVDAQWEEFDKVPSEATGLDAFKPLTDLLDILLEPLGDEDDKGKKLKASTVIAREYKADNIGRAHILALCERMGAVSQKRPT